MMRRYDIDWVRVIAIGLLLAYHVAIPFQPWGIMIGFIPNEKTWLSLWTPMMMLNVWRIPLLFFVSGMGVYFAMQSRTWTQLIKERAGRILVPYVAGIFIFVPVHLFLWQSYNGFELKYTPDPGHLWFLGNIFVYVVVLSPFFYVLRCLQHGKFVSTMKRLFSTPWGLIPVVAAFMMEVWLVKPNPYELYAMTWHGFFLGLLAFLFGFCFVLSGDTFWNMIVRWRWLFPALAAGLFYYRFSQPQMRVPVPWLPVESCLWILSVLSFGFRYLNHGSRWLNYLSRAAYPVYILHMIFLYLGSYWIFSLDISVYLQFVLLLLFTIAGCFLTYEFVVRRVKFIRPLFGLKSADV